MKAIRHRSMLFSMPLLMLASAMSIMPADAAFVPSATGAESRIAVAAEGRDANAAVSGIAARAPYVLIFDTTGKLVEVYPNPFVAASGNAGPSLAAWLAERGVVSFVAGEFGDKLLQAMKERKISPVAAKGPAATALGEAKQ